MNRETALHILNEAATIARPACRARNVAPQMRLTAQAFVAVLKADPALIEWKRDAATLLHVPHFDDVRVEITFGDNDGDRRAPAKFVPAREFALRVA